MAIENTTESTDVKNEAPVAPNATADEAQAPAKSRKKVKKLISDGVAHVKCTYNNTIVTISDVQGNVLSWATAASCGFKGSRKSTPFAASEAATTAAKAAIEKYGLKSVQVEIRGPGPGRESAVRAFHGVGLVVKSIEDVTRPPTNGCRDPKKRRV